MVIQVDIITTRTDLEGLGPEWDQLVHASSCVSPFLSWIYLSTWFEVYGARYQLRVLAARGAKGELLGIAPLMVGRGDTLKRRSLRHLSFIGGLGDTAAEFQDFIIHAGAEEYVVPDFLATILGKLRRDWDVLRLSMMPVQSPSKRLLERELSLRGLKFRTVSNDVAPFALLKPGWKSYLSTRSRNLRKALRNRRNRLEKEHELQFAFAGKELGEQAAVDALAQLNLHRWGKAALTFKSRAFVEFHRLLAQKLVASNAASVSLMLVDGTPAAAQYDLIFGGKAWGLVSGWNKSFAELGPGQVLTAAMLERYAELGLAEYDFLAGTADYKDDWSSGERILSDIEALNPRSCRAITFDAIREARRIIAAPFRNDFETTRH
jgi:CelD/BcsL family acetyltransferase involved in cellulose biosynthesis